MDRVKTHTTHHQVRLRDTSKVWLYSGINYSTHNLISTWDCHTRQNESNQGKLVCTIKKGGCSRTLNSHNISYVKMNQLREIGVHHQEKGVSRQHSTMNEVKGHIASALGMPGAG